MQYLACTGQIATSAGQPTCSGQWASSSAALTVQDGAQLAAAVIGCMVLGFVFRQARKAMGL